MELELRINGVIKSLDCAPNESLMTLLRKEGYFSVKHGCETGECGACTVLVDGVPRPSCVMLAAQAGGCTITTVESLGNARKLHAIQEAFIDTGAIQCGYCTPGMVLSAYALLKNNASPGEDEVRGALSGNLCRCTGYVKPVQAVLRAAAVLRGETVAPISRPGSGEKFKPWDPGRSPLEHAEHGANPPDDGTFFGGKDRPAGGAQGEGGVATMVETRAETDLRVVGKPERKVDAVKLVTGKPAYVDDIDLRDMLHARLLTSPHAHAIIRDIDVSQAKALPGVHAVLTYKDVPRIPYTTAGQSWPEPGPHDQYVLDNRVRFVGDRVAAVAAETPEIAEQALRLIQVDYEVLPPVLDPRHTMDPDAPRIHPEPESYRIHDASRNLAAYIEAEVGDVERGFAESDLVVEGEYIVPQVQQTPIENHIVITYWDEDDRLVVRTSTQVPYHVRRIIAPVIGLPPRQIHVIKPRIGGGFGGKQEVLIEDICALLTIATNRPVKLEYSRADEFRSSRSRHPQIIRMKTGVKRDGTMIANSMTVLANTGAYGTHSLTVQSNTGSKPLPIYPCPNIRFEANVVYTNLPPPGAFRGYGVPQGFFALESHIDEIAKRLGMDALELRRKNWIKEGDENPLARALGEGKEGYAQIIESCGLPQCLQIVEERLNWKEKRGHPGTGRFRRGVGVSLAMHGTAIAGLDMGGASLKLNDDGSFNLLVGATDIGTGSDTVLAQIAAEVLGVRVEDIIIHSSDTDFTPFDTGAYASSTTYISGGIERREIGIRGVDDNVLDAHAQHFCRDLCQHGIGAGADISRADQQVEGAIVVELEAGPAHIQAGNGGTVHGERDANAAPETPRAGMATFLLPVQPLLDDLQTLRQPAAFDDLRVALFALAQRARQRVFIALFNPVLAPQFQRVHAQSLRNLIDMAFEREEALGDAVATKRARWRQVGIDDVGLETNVGAGIDRQRLGAGVALHRQRVRAIRAGVGKHGHGVGNHGAVALDARLHANNLRVARAAAAELVGARVF